MCPIFLTKFQLNLSMHSCFNSKETLGALVSQKKLQERFASNLVCRIAYLVGISIGNFIELVKGSWRYKSVKVTFSFLLSIYSRCGAPASYATRHSTVCHDPPPKHLRCKKRHAQKTTNACKLIT